MASQGRQTEYRMVHITGGGGGELALVVVARGGWGAVYVSGDSGW